MKSRMLLMVFGISSLFLLNACIPGPNPNCVAGDLVAPIAMEPAEDVVVDSLAPALSWTYPDNTCDPEGYDLHLAMGPDYLTELGGTQVPGPWTPATPLLPGKVYEWWVSAKSGGTVGPAMERHIFFTGPECSSSELTAPVLIAPADGTNFHTAYDSVQWDSLDGCIPQGYRVQIFSEPTFTRMVYNQDFQKPWNSIAWYALPGDALTPFVECGWYYWRVAQLVDGVVGPFSETWSFRVHSYDDPCP